MVDCSTVLLAEDDPNDATLMQRAFERIRPAQRLEIVRNGREAINYLSGEASYANREEHPLPFLMLLDLKMPYVDGIEVLQWLRQRPELRPMMVVVLTSSDDDSDIQRAYDLGAHSFLLKPTGFADLLDLVKTLQGYAAFYQQQQIQAGETPKPAL